MTARVLAVLSLLLVVTQLTEAGKHFLNELLYLCHTSIMHCISLFVYIHLAIYTVLHIRKLWY